MSERENQMDSDSVVSDGRRRSRRHNQHQHKQNNRHKKKEAVEGSSSNYMHIGDVDLATSTETERNDSHKLAVSTLRLGESNFLGFLEEQVEARRQAEAVHASQVMINSLPLHVLSRNAKAQKQLKSQFLDTKRTLKDRESKLTEAERRLADLESQLTDAEERIEEASAREVELLSEIANLKLEPKRLLTHQEIMKEEHKNEVAELQSGIERLSKLLAQKESMVTMTEEEPDLGANAYQLQRLSEAGTRKDLEIEELKRKVEDQESDLESLRELNSTLMMKEYRDEDTDVAEAANEGLRSLNEALQKDLDKEREQHAEEKRKSEMEMRKFSEALKGVDELRNAAEEMSRELQNVKRYGCAPRPSNGTDRYDNPSAAKVKKATDLMASIGPPPEEKKSQERWWQSSLKHFNESLMDEASVSSRASSNTKNSRKMNGFSDRSVISH